MILALAMGYLSSAVQCHTLYRPTPSIALTTDDSPDEDPFVQTSTP